MQKENLFKQAQALISDYLTNKKVSKKHLSQKLNVSNAILTFIDQSQYEKVSEEMLLTIINKLKPSNGFNIVGTSNYNSIQNICQQTQDTSQMNAIIGYTGAGKSTALHDYYRQGGNVYYLECKNSMNRKQFLGALLNEMGLNYMGSVYDMINKLIDLLNSRRRSLLIIDEAGKLKTNILLDLHDLRNATMYNTGIILAGCEYFKTNLDKAVSKERIGYPEFHSRIVNWNILNRPTKAEIKAICEHNGLRNENAIKELIMMPNYRLLHNAIMNERDVA